MKTELTELSSTQKRLVFEIPADAVEAAIQRVTRTFARSARLPGFRQGKAPETVVRKKFKDDILHEVMHDLIPRSLGEAMKEHALDPVDTPDIKDVSLEEGSPLRFTAEFETVPPIEEMDYSTIQLRKPPVTVGDEAVDSVMSRLRERHARFEPVDDRVSRWGDTLTLDVDRTTLSSPTPEANEQLGEAEHQTDVMVEIGAPHNPPGFDDRITDLNVGDARTFVIRFPEDYGLESLRGAEVQYAITVKAIRKKVLPEVDDEFAKDLGLESLAALRERVHADLVKDAERNQDRELRDDLLRQLAKHVTVDVPQSLIDREVDRRLEEFVRRLVEQGVDPMKAGIEWEDFRARQRDAALDTVKATLMLDEVARREAIEVPEEAVEAEMRRFAELTGRSAAAVRSRLEQDGGLGRLRDGLRRDRAVEFLKSRATILEV